MAARGSSGGGGSRRHVVPSKSGRGWESKKPGTSEPASRHRTQEAAEKAAKKQVGREGGGEVVTHRRTGEIRDSDTVPPGRDPNPPRDKKH